MMGFKTKAMRQAEAQVKEPLDQYLRRRLNNGDRRTDIACDVGVSKATISYWLLKYGIQARWD